MRLLAACAAATAALALSACGGFVDVVRPDGQVRRVENRPLRRNERLDLDACVANKPGGRNWSVKFAAHDLRAAFARVIDGDSPDCAVRVETDGWTWSVFSRRDGRLLFTAEGHAGAGSNLGAWIPHAIAETLAPMAESLRAPPTPEPQQPPAEAPAPAPEAKPWWAK